MREFKFRAWCVTEKLMINQGDDTLGQFFDHQIIFPTTSITQQSIGLKDKNGKKIYEGDILLLPDEYTIAILDYGAGPTEPCNHLAEVVFSEEEAAFGVNISEDDDFIKKGFNSFSIIMQDMGSDYISKECEVVGNKFENAELLK